MGIAIEAKTKKYKKIITIHLKTLNLHGSSNNLKIFHLHNLICWFSAILLDYLITDFFVTLLQNPFTKEGKTSHFKGTTTTTKTTKGPSNNSCKLKIFVLSTA